MEVGESVGTAVAAAGSEVVGAREEVLDAGVVSPGGGEVERRVAGIRMKCESNRLSLDCQNPDLSLLMQLLVSSGDTFWAD